MFQKEDRHTYVAKPGNVDDWKYYLTTIASTKTYVTSGMNKLSNNTGGLQIFSQWVQLLLSNHQMHFEGNHV